MRKTKILSISIPAEMLSEAEALAKEENRTMSEFIREALRSYKRERQVFRGLLERVESQPLPVKSTKAKKATRAGRDTRNAKPAKRRSR